MAYSTRDDDRSLDGLCVFPTCENQQTDHLRLPVCERHIIKTYRLAHMMIMDSLPKSGTRSMAYSPGAEQGMTPGLIYFLRFGTRIKIGFTTNLERRLKAIPHEEVLATIPGTMKDEKRLHRRFDHLRQTGEWFRIEPDLTEFIEGLAA